MHEKFKGAAKCAVNRYRNFFTACSHLRDAEPCDTGGERECDVIEGDAAAGDGKPRRRRGGLRDTRGQGHAAGRARGQDAPAVRGDPRARDTEAVGEVLEIRAAPWYATVLQSANQRTWVPGYGPLKFSCLGSKGPLRRFQLRSSFRLERSARDCRARTRCA